MEVSPEIESLIPYKPGKPIAETQREYGLSRVYKLASNENALGPSPMAVQAMKDHLAGTHRYPDPGCYELAAKLAKKWEVPTSQIAFGNGSNEIIDLLIRIYCVRGDQILTSQAAFIAYKICAQAAGVKTVESPLKNNSQIDMSALAASFEKAKAVPKLVFFPNPNNPTGSYVPAEEIEEFLSRYGGRDDFLFVFDEAYHEFVRAKDYRSGLSYMKKYDNVLVMRTFSKVYGLAGLRIGALIGPQACINYFHRVRNPFNVNDLAQVGAAAAIDDHEYLKRSQELVWSGLDYFYKAFDELGLSYVPSQANFILLDLKQPAGPIYEALLKRGVIVRPVQAYGLAHHIRISVGQAEENEMVVQALREVLVQKD